MTQFLKITILSSVLFLSFGLKAQLKFESSIGAGYMNLNELNINNTPMFNGSLNLYGARYSAEWNANDFLLDFDFTLMASKNNVDSFRISQSAFLVSFLLGRKFSLSDDIAIKLYAGYTFGGFGITSSVENSIDYTSITGYDKSINLVNNSHFFTAKIRTELYSLFMSFSYNVSLLERDWKGANSTLINAPSDKFNNLTVTVGYVFGSKDD